MLSNMYVNVSDRVSDDQEALRYCLDMRINISGIKFFSTGKLELQVLKYATELITEWR
jgi:hypothetical protein